MNNRYLKKCLCCGSDELRLALDLGVQPPANSYARSQDERVEEYPLGLNICRKCWHAQLTFCVDRQAIFDRYAYVSGTSGTLTKFFAWFADGLAAALSKNARVLELAANDGSLIKQMQAKGLDCVGVDPARNIVEEARKEGLPIHCGYWPDVSDQVSGQFDAIVCMNVAAHVDCPRTFVAACKEKLKKGGALMIQCSQARMFGNYEFDTCYHEHLSFYNSRSMSALAEAAGLKLFAAPLAKIHGDSQIFILGHADTPPSAQLLHAFDTGDFAIADDLFTYEAQIRLFDWETYEKFRDYSKTVVSTLQKVIDDHRQKGFKVVFVGAAAKSMTVINAGKIRPDHFLDEAPLKIGLYAPGAGTLIDGLGVCKDMTEPTLFVLSAWNFRNELMSKIKAIGVPAGSVFYTYFPFPEFLS